MQTKNNLAYLLLILASLFWSGNFIVGKAASTFEIPPFSLNFYRWLFAWLILLPFTYKELINKKNYILNSDFFNQPHEIVFRSLTNLLKKIGNKYYSPRGKSVSQLLTKLGSGEIKKINISGCILEKINNSFVIYKEK